MDFTLSPEQTLLRDTVRRYCQERYRFQDRQTIRQSAEAFSREHWRAFAELGWLGAAMPEDIGGAGGSAIETALILEEFGRVLVLEPYVSCAVLAAHAIDIAGDDDQRQTLLPPLIRGELLAALAHVEAPSRGDPLFVETRARTTSGGYRLSGRKSMVPGGASADLLIVSARIGDGRDREGISLFAVRPDAPGLVRRAFRLVDGSQAAELLLDDVAVDRDALIGHEGEGAEPLEDAIDRALVGLCAEAVGAMDRVVTGTRDYLTARRAYGTTLSTLQALQHRLAEMFVELELSRSGLFRGLAALASWDRPARRLAIAGTKALIGRSGRLVGAHGIQLHGGMGMSDDYIIGHLFKRLTTIEALFGTSEFHLGKVASAFDAVHVHPVLSEC